MQLSEIESPLRSNFTFVEPWMLWQVEHCILPSRTGMWPERSTFDALSRWHEAHTSVCVAFLSWLFSDIALCTEWHVMQATPRDSC